MEPEIWKRLPADLLAKVQLKLKVLDVQRLRLVSRNWNALTDDSDFCRRHRLLHQPCCYECHFLLSCDSTPKCSFDASGVPFFDAKSIFQLWLLTQAGKFFKLPTPQAVDIPDTLPCRYLRSSSSGMVLILAYDTEFKTSSYYVWHPCRRSCHPIGSPRLYAVLLDALIVDEETLQFVVVVVGRVEQDDSPVTASIFDSKQEGWQTVETNFPVGKFDRIGGPLSCSKRPLSCTWVIEEASEREQQFLSSYFSSPPRWEHEAVEREVDWIQAPTCGGSEQRVVLKRRSSSRSGMPASGASTGAGTCLCVLSPRRNLWMKVRSEADWRSIQLPASKSGPLSTVFSFHLVL